jgi:hypothetical protein
MIGWIFENLDKVLIALGACVILFWPKIKAALSGASPAAPASTSGCPCCAPKPAEEPVSAWVNRQLEVRDYCERRGLAKAIEACDVVITEIITGEPSDKMAIKGG